MIGVGTDPRPRLPLSGLSMGHSSRPGESLARPAQQSEPSQSSVTLGSPLAEEFDQQTEDTPPELDQDTRGRSIAYRTARLRKLLPERTIRRVIEDCREDPDFAAYGAADWDFVYELFGVAQAGDDIPDDEDDFDDSNSNGSGGAH